MTTTVVATISGQQGCKEIRLVERRLDGHSFIAWRAFWLEVVIKYGQLTLFITRFSMPPSVLVPISTYATRTFPNLWRAGHLIRIWNYLLDGRPSL